MHLLNETQTQFISGGYYVPTAFVYVTEGWKQNQAEMNGTLFGVLGGLSGVLLGSTNSASLGITGLGFGIAGGYGLGWCLSTTNNFHLENDCWYEFPVAQLFF